jgi:uncharacterized protein (TIGR02118 family)
VSASEDLAMVKLICLINRPETLTADAFRQWWLGHHAHVAARLPGLRRYTINVARGTDGPYDGVAELWFDDEDALSRAFDSDEGRECAREDRELIRGRVAFLTEEHVIVA